ncbi:hypothetical protein Taro_055891, partial [Colocasia esculenta]|nr:hypothetical protein [Colocasia esculenta]
IFPRCERIRTHPKIPKILGNPLSPSSSLISLVPAPDSSPSSPSAAALSLTLVKLVGCGPLGHLHRRHHHVQASTLKGQEDVVTDYIMKILGLEMCVDILVGNEMVRGISGGQKKRVTTDEHQHLLRVGGPSLPSKQAPYRHLFRGGALSPLS